MNVKELIHILKNCDPDWPVILEDSTWDLIQLSDARHISILPPDYGTPPREEARKSRLFDAVILSS